MNLPQFFEYLDQHEKSVPLEELSRLMRRLEVTEDDIAHVIAFDDEKYKRNVLHVGSGYAALVLCWKPGQKSPIHDHHGSACGVMVIKGAVTETQFKRHPDGQLEETVRATLNAGEMCGSYDADIHIIANESMDGENLITLHIYTPPLREFHYYFREDPRVETVVDTETAKAIKRLTTAGATA